MDTSKTVWSLWTWRARSVVFRGEPFARGRASHATSTVTDETSPEGMKARDFPEAYFTASSLSPFLFSLFLVLRVIRTSLPSCC